MEPHWQLLRLLKVVGPGAFRCFQTTGLPRHAHRSYHVGCCDNVQVAPQGGIRLPPSGFSDLYEGDSFESGVGREPRSGAVGRKADLSPKSRFANPQLLAIGLQGVREEVIAGWRLAPEFPQGLP